MTGLTYDISTLVYSVNTDTYSEGPRPAKQIERAAAVPYGDSFLFVGGFDFEEFVDASGNFNFYTCVEDVGQEDTIGHGLQTLSFIS